MMGDVALRQENSLRVQQLDFEERELLKISLFSRFFSFN